MDEKISMIIIAWHMTKNYYIKDVLKAENKYLFTFRLKMNIVLHYYYQ